MKKAVIAILLAQLAVIGAIIWRWEEVSRKGLEFRVPCRAYDPRDPWRGRYLRANVRADVTAVTNHVIVANKSKGPDCLARGFVMVDRHSVTGAPPLLVYKDEEPTLNPPFYFAVKSAHFNCATSTWQTDLPNTLYISERIADKADEILAGELKRGITNRAVAVYRAWKGDIIMTDIEIDGVSITDLAR